MKHTCDKHPMYMKQGKNNFTNLMCKLCDTYIKHSSHYELKVYEWYQSNNEHHHLTVEQVIEEAQELKEETFHLDPEQYIDAYGDNVIWMSVHYRNKELAKQYKALWEPRIKMWYTYVDHPQALREEILGTTRGDLRLYKGLSWSDFVCIHNLFLKY